MGNSAEIVMLELDTKAKQVAVSIVVLENWAYQDSKRRAFIEEMEPGRGISPGNVQKIVSVIYVHRA
jgi:hypothetical protein